MPATGLKYAKQALALSLAIWASIAEADTGRSLEFLYINANEGSASGGHAALKFEQQVFHFQHVEPGLLRLFRDDFAAFEFAYGFQENRTIRGHSIEVAEDFFIALREAFTRRLLIQNQQFAALQALYDDHALISGLQNPGTARHLPLNALGYFLSDYRAGESPASVAGNADNTSPQLIQLRQAIGNEYGADFLAGKRLQTWQILQSLKPDLSVAITDLSDDNFKVADASFARRYRDQLLNLAALDVLHAAMPPIGESLIRATLPKFQLKPAQLGKLANFRQRLFNDLVELMRSRRTDWGFPLLVGMARLHALDDSIASGYLTLLDRSRQIPDQPQNASVDADTLPSALQYTQQVFNAAASQLNDAEELDERGYAELELSATALLQLHRPTDGKQLLKLPHLTTAPTRAGTAELVNLPLSAAELAQNESSIAEQLDIFQDRLLDLYDYQLLSRNCATEIFRVINQTLASFAGREPLESPSQASLRLLGGYIDEQGLNNIPFLAYARVADEYRVGTSFERLPYRERQRRELYRHAPEWQVDLQESNPLSSTIYHWNDTDAAFLFFTQDQIWPRPLMGSLNLAVAGGQALYGLFSWPWDGGDNLHKSLKGIFVSLPELLFCNIRKGSFPGLLPGVTKP
jgi:hypothetical protein